MSSRECGGRLEIDVIKKEICDYSFLKKIPLVATYAVETFIDRRVPAWVKRCAGIVCSVAFAGASLFSISLLPMLYVYNRDKDDEDSQLVAR